MFAETRLKVFCWKILVLLFWHLRCDLGDRTARSELANHLSLHIKVRSYQYCHWNIRHDPSQPKEILKTARRNCVLNVSLSLHTLGTPAQLVNTHKVDLYGLKKWIPLSLSGLASLKHWDSPSWLILLCQGKNYPQIVPQPPTHTEIPPGRPSWPVYPLMWCSALPGVKKRPRGKERPPVLPLRCEVEKYLMPDGILWSGCSSVTSYQPVDF